MVEGMTLIGIALGIVLGWVARDKAGDERQTRVTDALSERVRDLANENAELREQVYALQERIAIQTELDERDAPYSMVEGEDD